MPYRRNLLQWKTLMQTSWLSLGQPENLFWLDIAQQWATQKGCARSVAPYWDDPELGASLCDVLMHGITPVRQIFEGSDVELWGWIVCRYRCFTDQAGRPIHTEGVGLVIKFDDDTLRSVLPYAMCMTPSHPFGLLLIEQLNFNLSFSNNLISAGCKGPAANISMLQPLVWPEPHGHWSCFG